MEVVIAIAILGGLGLIFGLVLAAAMITSIIPLVVYFFGMDKIVEGMTAGAVKS